MCSLYFISSSHSLQDEYSDASADNVIADQGLEAVLDDYDRNSDRRLNFREKMEAGLDYTQGH